MSLVSIEARNASLAMSYGASRGSLAPDSLEVALFDGDPANGGTEITGGGYARLTVPNDATTWPDAPASGAITSAQLTMATSSGAWTGEASYFQLYDADTGDAWDDGVLATPVAIAAAGVVPRPTLTVFYEDPTLGA